MKRVLITGGHGYIGSSFLSYMERYAPDYEMSTISLRDECWQDADFSIYDVIVHTAGLAHIKETSENRALYDTVNCDLTVKVAEKAKREGVRQFVFLSTMSVYGMDEGEITSETVPCPRSRYGKSKLQAESYLQAMQSELFRVAILRPPMVYGDGCKGNYQMLVKLAACLPVLPDYKNRRSMISIENLCVYMRNCIEHNLEGVLLPQDPEYVCTCQMIQDIAAAHGRKLRMTRLLNFGPAVLRRWSKRGRKAFGSLYYKYE